MDTGPIIAQKEIEILPDDTKEELQKKIQQAEHVMYPEVLQELFS